MIFNITISVTVVTLKAEQINNTVKTEVISDSLKRVPTIIININNQTNITTVKRMFILDELENNTSVNVKVWVCFCKEFFLND